MSTVTRHLDIALDGATARLIKIAQAVQVSCALPTASSRSLVNLAKGARLATEARERAFACALLADIDTLAQTCADEDPTDALRTMLLRHTTAVRKALAFNEKG